MKNNRTVLFLIIFAVCLFCFVSCGRNNTTGSTPNGTGTGSGSISGNMSNDTVNSNRGNADGGTADDRTNGGIIDGAAEDVARHRIVLNTKARVSHVKEDAVLDQILQEIGQPTSYMKRAEYRG